jgi:predicted nuclease of predicted toxin-antitoxin system
MRLLVDENVHRVVVERLRAAGYETEWIAEKAGAGASDEAILTRPDIGTLTFITYDRDFGELIFKRGLPTPRRIIYSRLGRADPRHMADRILLIIENGALDHHLITITRDGERFKVFPDGANDG